MTILIIRVYNFFWLFPAVGGQQKYILFDNTDIWVWKRNH